MPKKGQKQNGNPGWKQVERRLALLFGTSRRTLSGGNSKQGRDDCMHPTLFLEAKLQGKCAFGTLYRKTLEMAEKEKRIPVLGIQEKRRKGMYIVFNSIYFKDVAKAWAEANGYRLIKIGKKNAD